MQWMCGYRTTAVGDSTSEYNYTVTIKSLTLHISQTIFFILVLYLLNI